MNFSNLFFKPESDPANNNGSTYPVMYELRANWLAGVEPALPMIKKAYELSTSTGGIEPIIVSSNLDKVPTETDQQRREKISPAVAQVAAVEPITDIQASVEAQARATIYTIHNETEYKKVA